MATAAKSHKARMIERRERQRARAPGFTPVRNARIDSAIQAQMLLLMQTRGLSAPDAEAQARRTVASRLPKASPSKLYRYRPSKSDSPAYRKATS